MTVEELKAILEEIPNECEVEIFTDDGDAEPINTVQLNRIYKKGGYIEKLQFKGLI